MPSIRFALLVLFWALPTVASADSWEIANLSVVVDCGLGGCPGMYEGQVVSGGYNTTDFQADRLHIVSSAGASGVFLGAGHYAGGRATSQVDFDIIVTQPLLVELILGQGYGDAGVNIQGPNVNVDVNVFDRRGFEWCGGPWPYAAFEVCPGVPLEFTPGAYHVQTSASAWFMNDVIRGSDRALSDLTLAVVIPEPNTAAMAIGAVVVAALTLRRRRCRKALARTL